MKNYRISKKELKGNFISLPERDSGIFNLPAPAFKIYVWLSSHSIGFKFNRKFLDAGVKMHHCTVTEGLKILEELGAIKNVNFDIEIVTFDIKVYHIKKKENQKRKKVKSDSFSFESKSTGENVKVDISDKENKKDDFPSLGW